LATKSQETDEAGTYAVTFPPDENEESDSLFFVAPALLFPPLPEVIPPLMKTSGNYGALTARTFLFLEKGEFRPYEFRLLEARSLPFSSVS